jgi:TRAP-type mannitol/chloroaromatic compound transport system permease large subunit
VLGWPFEWPAIILVFLPIFYPVIEALRPAVAQTLGIAPDMFMIWFGALVAVTLQTAYLSPPVAMSAYYLKQVVKDWSLGTIYSGMFQFMILQCVAIAAVMFVPSIATYLPEKLQAESRAAVTEEADDSMNSLEADPAAAMKEQAEEDEKAEALEKGAAKAKK